jgi:hypothetical protein
MKILQFIKNKFTRCERCRKFGAGKYRQNTCYVDDERNFVTLCPSCEVENDEYWEWMWENYRLQCY